MATLRTRPWRRDDGFTLIEAAVSTVVVAVLFVVFTAGLPLGISLWLWRCRDSLDAKKTRDELGFLYEVYGTGKGQVSRGLRILFVALTARHPLT